MTNHLFKKLALGFAATGLAMSAQAAGIGVSLSFGSFDLDADSSNDPDIEADVRSFGFMFDTAKPHRTFQYRLTVNRFSGDLDVENSNNDGEFDGLEFNNSFGFKLVENETVRVWLGPQIQINSGDIDMDSGDDGDYFGLGFGLSGGVDIKVTPEIDLVAETAWRNTSYDVDLDDNFGSDDYDANDTYMKLGVMFRFGRRNQ